LRQGDRKRVSEHDNYNTRMRPARRQKLASCEAPKKGDGMEVDAAGRTEEGDQANGEG